MTDKEQVIREVEEELHLAEYWGQDSREVDVSLLERVLALLEKQEDMIQHATEVAEVYEEELRKHHII